MNRHGIILVILILTFISALQAQNSDTLEYSWQETDSVLNVKIWFAPRPEYGQPTSLHIYLEALNSKANDKALRPYEPNVKNPILRDIGKRKDIFNPGNSLDLAITAGPKNYVEIPDTILKWMAPIKVGDTFEATIPVEFRGIGNFNITLSEKKFTRGSLRFLMDLALDENGHLAFWGKHEQAFENPLNAHLPVFGEKIIAFKAGEKDIFRGTKLIEPFDITMSVEPTPKIGDTSTVSFSIATMDTAIDKIQYELIHARNILIDTVPPSQDINPGEDQRFECSFKIIPQSSGQAYISFKVFGLYQPDRLKQIVSSDIAFHLVFDDDGTLLYMGEVDPFAAGFESGNPAYAKTEKILDYADSGYGLKTERSQPDFEYDRMQEQFIQDSIEAARQQDSSQTDDAQDE